MKLTYLKLIIVGALGATAASATSIGTGPLTTCPIRAVVPGAAILALPSSHFTVCFEDLPLSSSDLDYNDFMLWGVFDTSGTHADLTFLGASAGLLNVLTYGPSGPPLMTSATFNPTVTISTTPGGIVQLNDLAGGNIWSTGSLNAIVLQDGGTPGTPTPEPGTATLAAIGLGLSLTSAVRRGRLA